MARQESGIRRTKGEKALETVILILLIITSAAMLFPFLNLLAKSLSGESAVLRGDIVIFPKDFQIGTYQYVMRQSMFFTALKNTLIVTIAGTFFAMFVTCITAYPLSKGYLVGRKGLILYFVFTMLFSGGMIPSYLLIRSLGMLNTLWVLFIPGMTVYNMILLKNFFEEIPASVEESAQLDGAKNMTVLFRIVLPMSLPAIATIGLFYAVGFWNNYMGGIMYITRPALKPLQQYLYEVITEVQNAEMAESLGELDADSSIRASLNTESIRAATIMLSTLPIICVYPFLQKYFVAGLRVGSVKG